MKAGDKIKCVGPIHGCLGLTIGKIYDTTRVGHDGDPFFTNDNGDESCYCAFRFKVVTNTLQDQINEAISLIGKTVEHDDVTFTVTAWGIGNKYSDFSCIIDNLVDGVCVYVDNANGLAPLSKLNIVDNMIEINDDFNATIEGDVVKVGHQIIPIEKVKQIIELYEKLNK